MAKYTVTYDRDGNATYRIDGVVVTKKQYDKALPSHPIEVPLEAHKPDAWPIVSKALGVHPRQIPEAIEHARRNGVPTEFTSEGRPILRDRAHRKAYLRMQGYHDRDGTYGD